MSSHIIEFDEKCKSCKGTGLYVGMGERDGAAVVCHTCKGTGCHHVKIEYEDFLMGIPRGDVIQVFEVNPGICIGTGDDTYQLSDFGGMPYQEWLDGKQFERGMENRKFTCPTWWYQTANYNLKPKWKECFGCNTFSSCKYFKNKDKCWERFDKELQ